MGAQRCVGALTAAMARGMERRVVPLRDAIAEAKSYGFLIAEDLKLVETAKFVLQIRESIADREWVILEGSSAGLGCVQRLTAVMCAPETVHDALKEGIDHHEVIAAKRGIKLRKMMRVVAKYLKRAIKVSGCDRPTRSVAQ